MTEHTKTPWVAVQYPDQSWGVRSALFAIATIVAQDMEDRDNGEEAANSRFIVTACNHHDELVAALKRIASGEGYYGAQAAEYKQIARDVLSELEAEDAK